MALLSRTRLFGECRGEAGLGRLAVVLDGPADVIDTSGRSACEYAVEVATRRVTRSAWAGWTVAGGSGADCTEVDMGRKGDVDVGGGVKESVDMFPTGQSRLLTREGFQDVCCGG